MNKALASARRRIPASLRFGLIAGALVALTFLALNISAAAQTETVLHSFGSGVDGQNPWTGLVIDTQGNLYGTTVYGGTEGYGTTYEVMPATGGGWSETVIHNFSGVGVGYAGLAVGPMESLYGLDPAGLCQLRPYNANAWELKALLNISEGGLSNLTLSPRGGFYSTGANVYSLVQANNVWKATQLYSFYDTNYESVAPAALDSLGNVYVSTNGGGTYNVGSILRFSKSASGVWTENTIYTFQGGNDAAIPWNMVFDSAGNLYGASEGGGGANNVGTIFKLSPIGGGKWAETVIYRFSGGNDGAFPIGGLIFGSDGSLYGTTQMGGGGGTCQNGSEGLYYCGTVFKLTPPATKGRPWTETVLHSFTGGDDGQFPSGSLVFDTAGNLYGTTNMGGSSNLGTVFEIAP